MVELKKLLLPGSFSFLAAAFPSVLQSRQDADKPAAFFLAGDSTTVTVGGWGGGFLNTTLVNGAWGTNFASSGTTTVSFRGEGHWNDTIEAVKNVTANGDYTAWVTIQFGHNDQKAAANITLEEFSANLATFVDEVRDAGGYPILVSPLSRRSFSGDPERVIENLANHTAAALEVAEEKGALSIDLNGASTDYLNAIGSADADTYNLSEGDHTHLNDAGAAVFGNMVAWLLDTSAESDLLSESTVAGEEYVQAFEDGVYIAE